MQPSPIGGVNHESPSRTSRFATVVSVTSDPEPSPRLVLGIGSGAIEIRMPHTLQQLVNESVTDSLTDQLAEAAVWLELVTLARTDPGLAAVSDAVRRARPPDARCGRLTVRRRRVVLLVRHRRTLRGRVTALR